MGFANFWNQLSFDVAKHKMNFQIFLSVLIGNWLHSDAFKTDTFKKRKKSF